MKKKQKRLVNESLVFLIYYSTINAYTFIESSLEIVYVPADNVIFNTPSVSIVYDVSLIIISLPAESEIIVKTTSFSEVKLIEVSNHMTTYVTTI